MSSMSVRQPGALMRAVFRAPIQLYEANLGWLLGERFLCLTHVGRKSGRQYRTALEVVGTNPTAGEFMVIAGFGPSSTGTATSRPTRPAKLSSVVTALCRSTACLTKPKPWR
jgi:hypothetical protein